MYNEPKYIKIKKDILSMIENNEIHVGDKIPSESELTEKYNVSRHTVRKALDSLREKDILDKRQGVGTFYIGEVKTTNNLIGFISISVHDYIFSDIMKGIDEVLHDTGYQTMVGNSKDNIEREKEIIDNFVRKGIDGLIIEPAKSAYKENNLLKLKKIARRGIPVVILDSDFSASEFSYVIVDDKKGGKIAASYFIEKGHKRIAQIYKDSHIPGKNRLKGFKEEIKNSNIAFKEKYIKKYKFSELETPGKFYEEIQQVVNELMSDKNPPTGIFCFNDQVAINVVENLIQMGFNVPGDVSVIGYDDSKFVQLNSINITSIAHPKEKAGKKAARLILDKQCNINGQEKIVFEPLLVERASVKQIN